MPSIDQMFEQLRARGHRCGRDCETPSWPGVLKNSDGQWVVLVDDVAVFHGDADDMLRGVPLKKIIERNRGANLGEFSNALVSSLGKTRTFTFRSPSMQTDTSVANALISLARNSSR